MHTHLFAILKTFVTPIARGIGVSATRVYHYLRHRPRTALVVVILIIAAFIGASYFFKEPIPEISQTTRAVSLVRAGDQGTAEPLSVIGEVRSVKEALVSFDSSGTVAGVYRALGDYVALGQSIASLKNDREQAAVTQAEATLVKAKAGAAISDIGVGTASDILNTATIGALNAVQNARSTIGDAILRRTDTVFENPTNNTRTFLVTAPAFNLVQQTLSKRGDVQIVIDGYTKATTPSGTDAIVTTLE